MSNIQFSAVSAMTSTFEDQLKTGVENKELQVISAKMANIEPQVKSLNQQVEAGTVSMSQLMKLIGMIIDSSKELRSQLLFNRIDEAMSTLELGIALAQNKKETAQVKFGINMAISLVSMTIQTASAYQTSKFKTVKDKHLPEGKVSDLSAQQRNDISATLQQARTAKYNNVTNLAQMSNKVGSDGVEFLHADNVRHDEENQASKETKQKFDEQLTQFIESLGNELVQLLKMMEAIQGAALVTNR
ncbi:type III secretion system protein [Photorhabdus heterorhabditis]|uniref:type III secretion system protein n=1 Tax=Photorhabdus heterorhabditis TaxID=880156 RepID=UPI001562DA43|nr:type III secretion system protein [Photorhabdus heterorhabditis]NRN28539.1 type III secretion system protein [Photorhabdus heterorhabditis subsp. aluminescens]